MKVIIDPRAGFCSGVRRVIRMAEEEVRAGRPLIALGELIHNHVEMDRLKKLGLQVADATILQQPARSVRRLLIRAHGEPPATYQKAREKGYEIVEGTCPIVIRSQKLARKYNQQGYQVVLVGKHGHPEVVGIQGHCDERCYVVSHVDEVEQVPANEKTFVLAQTTISAHLYLQVVEKLKQRTGELVTRNTICGFIAGRDRQISEFARSCDVIVMVGGRHSSNTRVLFQVCQQNNPRAYWIEHPDELHPEWFRTDDTVGITGGASTPQWLMEKVRDHLLQLSDNPTS